MGKAINWINNFFHIKYIPNANKSIPIKHD